MLLDVEIYKQENIFELANLQRIAHVKFQVSIVLLKSEFVNFGNDKLHSELSPSNKESFHGAKLRIGLMWHSFRETFLVLFN